MHEATTALLHSATAAAAAASTTVAYTQTTGEFAEPRALRSQLHECIIGPTLQKNKPGVTIARNATVMLAKIKHWALFLQQESAAVCSTLSQN